MFVAAFPMSSTTTWPIRSVRPMRPSCKPKRVAVGRDIRHSSSELQQALIRGLTDCGVDVADIGLCGTEAVYFATFVSGLGRRHHGHRQPQSARLQRHEVRARAEPPDQRRHRPARDAGHDRAAPVCPPRRRAGRSEARSISAQRYLEHLLSYVDSPRLKPLKVVVNAGNGGAGLIVDQLEPHLPFEFVKINHAARWLLSEWRAQSHAGAESRTPRAEAVAAPVPIWAWPGTAITIAASSSTSEGGFIEGYYLVGLLAESFLRRHHGARIVHDPRLTWNTIDIVQQLRRTAGAVQVRACLHQAEDARGGRGLRRRDECSSLLPRFRLLRQRHDSVAAGARDHVGVGQDRSRSWSASARDCFRPAARSIASSARQGRCQSGARHGCSSIIRRAHSSIEFIDGLSMEFDRWRFNLRGSNTEPLVRLNVESRGDVALMQENTAEVLRLLDGALKASE